MREKYLPLMVSIIVSFLFVTVYTYGATTISTNVNTGGTLTASGATTLNGNVTLGDAATDTIWSQGLFNASSTLQVTGAVRFYSTSITDGTATFSGSIAANGNVTVGDAIGDNLTITAGTVTMSNVATTTIPNAKVSAWTIATSTTTSIPTFTVSTVSSPVGRVGIGTSTPSTELDVNGYVRVMQAATGTACVANIKGAIFYNDANGLFWGCDGTNWTRLTD